MIKLTPVKKKYFVSIEPSHYSKSFTDIYNCNNTNKYSGKVTDYADYHITISRTNRRIDNYKYFYTNTIKQITDTDSLLEITNDLLKFFSRRSKYYWSNSRCISFTDLVLSLCQKHLGNHYIVNDGDIYYSENKSPEENKNNIMQALQDLYLIDTNDLVSDTFISKAQQRHIDLEKEMNVKKTLLNSFLMDNINSIIEDYGLKATENGIIFEYKNSYREGFDKFVMKALHELIEIPLKEQLNLDTKFTKSRSTALTDGYSVSCSLKDIRINTKES